MFEGFTTTSRPSVKRYQAVLSIAPNAREGRDFILKNSTGQIEWLSGAEIRIPQKTGLVPLSLYAQRQQEVMIPERILKGIPSDPVHPTLTQSGLDKKQVIIYDKQFKYYLDPLESRSTANLSADDASEVERLLKRAMANPERYEITTRSAVRSIQEAERSAHLARATAAKTAALLRLTQRGINPDQALIYDTEMRAYIDPLGSRTEEEFEKRTLVMQSSVSNWAKKRGLSGTWTTYG